MNCVAFKNAMQYISNMRQTHKHRPQPHLDVGTFARLRRSYRPFDLVESRLRRLASTENGQSAIQVVSLGPWQEGTRGDAMHKLVFVAAGQIDVEGEHGGWLVPSNHMIFIPSDRAFNLRASQGTRLLVVHMEAADCTWPRPGCWVNAADETARVLLRYPLRWADADEQDARAARLFLKTLATVCVDWFDNPRTLHIPAAVTPPMQQVFRYLETHLAAADLAGASRHSGLSARTLQRLCEQEIAMSWRELVREARMMRAVELLLQGRHSISEIAAEVGFRNPGAFATAFTACRGTSPSGFARAFAAEPDVH
jgi:AraC-like DNA-binding protein